MNFDRPLVIYPILCDDDFFTMIDELSAFISTGVDDGLFTLGVVHEFTVGTHFTLLI